MGPAETSNASLGVDVVAKPEWGVKRGCLNCGTKFYDFGRDPIVCPNCKTSFRAEDFARPRRSARPERAEVAPAAKAPVPKRPAVADEDEADLVEVDEALDVVADDEEEVNGADLEEDEVAGTEGEDSDDEEMALAGDAELEGVEDADELDEEDETDDDVLEAEDDEDLENEISSEIDTDFRKEDVG